MFGSINIVDMVFDPGFLVTACVAVLAFATIVTLALPALERDTLNKRLKSVSQRREELRARHKEQISGRKGTSLRADPVGGAKLIKKFSDRFDLAKLVASEDSQGKLAQAGLRGPTPLMVFNFFRFVMPFLVFAVALLYLFLITNFAWAPMVKLMVAMALTLMGYYFPDLYITNLIQKRQQSIMAAFPDALDLLLICVESGMSVEAGFAKVAAEIGQSSAELAEEFALTTAELSYLPDRKQAFENLAKRCGHQGVKAVATALNQAERYGTPLGQALRVCAQENRDMRMMDAERKAAALPAKLTVPMILFFLPCLFVVIMGPAIMKISHVM
ncbi:tight adherence protein C [Rhizomicrobium palustre]|uniref:Tight adherence protein C n=1 Tax=Rhizomicrobium palustre TaxID=189966 RepID=A0A846MXZ1_9PROT|nr:type II secretion system F family protein [Rhizomicrobium palustre]NIK87880.1 tight adherence protein C [Rhizomicrobium palustre]